jgi:hypothetical protein
MINLSTVIFPTKLALLPYTAPTTGDLTCLHVLRLFTQYSDHLGWGPYYLGFFMLEYGCLKTYVTIAANWG